MDGRYNLPEHSSYVRNTLKGYKMRRRQKDREHFFPHDLSRFISGYGSGQDRGILLIAPDTGIRWVSMDELLVTSEICRGMLPDTAWRGEIGEKVGPESAYPLWVLNLVRSYEPGFQCIVLFPIDNLSTEYGYLLESRSLQLNSYPYEYPNWPRHSLYDDCLKRNRSLAEAVYGLDFGPIEGRMQVNLRPFARSGRSACHGVDVSGFKFLEHCEDILRYA